MADLLVEYLETKASTTFFEKQKERWQVLQMAKNPFKTDYVFLGGTGSVRHAYIVMRPLYPNFSLWLGVASAITIYWGFYWTPALYIGYIALFIALIQQAVFSSTFLLFGLRLGLRKAGYKETLRRITGDDKSEALIQWLKKKY